MTCPWPAPVTSRKPVAPAQWNWIRQEYEFEPQQLELALEDGGGPHDAEDRVSVVMTEGGTQLVVSGFGMFVGKKSERVVVKKGREVVVQTPMVGLQEVVVGSRGVSVSSDVIDELCLRGIRLAFLKSSGQPYALLTSPMLTATVETRRAQMEAVNDNRGADMCRWIVAGKIHNQEKLLLYFSKSRDGVAAARLRDTASALRGMRKEALRVEGGNAHSVRSRLMGLEGTAGRMYWREVAAMAPEGLGFTGRQHMGATDELNAMLNYGYGILYSHVWGAAMNAGLEPFAGFLHVDRSGKPSLVLDLCEEFRQPVVDRAVLTWVNRGGRGKLSAGMLDAGSREEVAARVLARLLGAERHRGKSYQVRSIIQMQARVAAAAVRGWRKYRPFAFQW